VGIADRKSVESALRTLTSRGEIVRVLPGLFTKPLPPGFEARRQTLIRLVGEAVAQSGHVAVPDGAAAAFELGLIPQPPILARFLTTIEERTFEVGRVRVTLVNADPWWFLLPDRLAGTAIRALGWAGSSRVAAAWRTLSDRLPAEVIDEVQAQARHLPLWMAAVVSNREAISARA
jgi:hypothetical protein